MDVVPNFFKIILLIIETLLNEQPGRVTIFILPGVRLEITKKLFLLLWLYRV